jgi:hypothetical protein
MKAKLQIIFSVIFAGCLSASAQYYEMSNRLFELLTPSLSGSLNYKGFVEGEYLVGIGSKRADFVEISTSQGFKYSSWFYMGVGAGVQLMTAHTSDNWFDGYCYNSNRETTDTGVAIPLFTDFRFNIGGYRSNSLYIDLRLGCSFLVSSDDIRIGDGYITDRESFYFRPSVGIRFPLGDSERKAIDFGISYQLVSNDYWTSWSNDINLSGLGVSVAYEW